MRCAKAREMLQDLHDAGRAIGPELEAHCAGCESCARFNEFLEGFGADVKKGLDDAASVVPLPDLHAVLARAEDKRADARPAGRRLKLIVMPAAAVLIAGIGLGVGVLLYSSRGTHALVADNVTDFVDELFAVPIASGAELPAPEPVDGLRSWLESPEAAEVE